MNNFRLFLLLISGCIVVSNDALAQKGWYKIETGINYQIVDLYFANQDTGYVLGLGNNYCCMGNIMLKTTNGGKNWTRLLDSIPSLDSNRFLINNKLVSLGFWNDSVGVVSGVFEFAQGQENHSFIMSTNNSGTLWNGDTLASHDNWGALKALPGGIGFVVTSFQPWISNPAGGGGGSIWKTTNFGKNWSDVFSGGDNVNILSVDFQDSLKGIAIAKDHKAFSNIIWFWHTYNGGSYWNGFSINFETFDDYQKINTINNVSGDHWILGTDNNIYSSNDFGGSWKKIKDNTKSVGNFSFYKGQFGYCVPGAYYDQVSTFTPKSGFLYKTLDSGKTWFPQLKIDSSNYLYKVFTVNDTVAYAVGANGLVLKTTDGGGAALVEVKDRVDQTITLSVSPNPTLGNCSLTFKESKINRQLRLYNILGQEVFSSIVHSGANRFTLERNNLPQGIYYIILGIETEKIIFE